MLESMNVAIFVGSALVVAAVFTSLISFRFGAPLLLVFLGVGLLAGEDGLGLSFNNANAAYFVGSIALAIILFDAGFETRLSTLRIAALPAMTLATVGVALTAVLVSVAARLLLGVSFGEGLLLGAIVAPTDAAAVFFLLRVGGITLRDRVRSTLEVESGTNDPIAIFLTLTMVEIAAAGPAALGGTLVDFSTHFILQIGVGAAVGLAAGFLIVQIVNRTDFEAALYPIIVLALALATFAFAGMIEGSGFLAVYVAGIVAGNTRIRHAVALRRFQTGSTWLSQIAMFLTLGLLATPSQFSAVLVPAFGLAVFLMVVARPIAVWLCLLPYGFSRHEMAFVSWVGLRGAVSILLAILPIIAGLSDARALFNTAFIVVIASLLVQGWTIRPVARFLGLIVPPRLGPVDRIELELPGRADHEIISYVVHPDSPVGKGQRIPRWARPSLLVRDGRSLRPHRVSRPQTGDQVYVITTPDYIGLLDRLFAAPAQGADDPRLYGEFVLQPDTRLVDMAKAYGATVPPGDAGLTIAELLRRELAGVIEQGDRVAYGPIDLIVRRVDDEHHIGEVGLALEHGRRARPRIPLFQSPREIREFFRGFLSRRRPPAEPPASQPDKTPPIEPAEPAKPPEPPPSAD